MRIILISVFCLIMVGCAASMGELRAISSGKTGCPTDGITIEDSRVGMKTASWTAKCGGKTYFCSGDDMLRGVTCTEQK